ncbi:MAG: leucyl/phenylalanyl-tRNA--protein transferase [Planctomycetes bacterium]|nr:leucyl/phenylalanyl-tRNA--protein transferase [Planctomycetota bacterium]
MPPQVDLSPAGLLAAYAHGAFPMADGRSGLVRLFTCDPRCVIPLDGFRLPAATLRAIRRSDFVIRTDTDFERCMRHCADRPRGDSGSWISEALVQAYVRLHREGHAHSVEAWRGTEMVGGLYGVSLGGAFFGESMFVRPDAGGTNSSKACLAWLVSHLRARGFTLLDSQYANDHILSLGAQEIPVEEYLERLEAALQVQATF